MRDLEQIIQLCKKHDPKAQKELYDRYSAQLYGICLRYVSEKSAAADILQDGFLKILTKIDEYAGLGSFEGWMKRIIINTAITDYHKNKKHNNTEIGEIKESKIEGTSFETPDYTHEELLKVVQSLPDGYRMVFNMYAVEGYKHKEIAKIMEIDVGTSKSQYSRAKKIIREKLEQLAKIKVNE